MLLNQNEKMPAGYKWSLGGSIFSFGMILLAIVDFRRGFLFAFDQGFGGYLEKTSYFVFSPMQVMILGLGILGFVVSYFYLRNYETQFKDISYEKYLRISAFILLILLIADLFAYRGVAATRLAIAGQVSADWLKAYGTTGWLRPIYLTVSYLLTVWHATFLGILLAGLSLTILPRYMYYYFSQKGFKGSVAGALFSIPQPFCSCCASVIAPALAQSGASSQFSLAFVVGAPMLNISTLILASMMLPTSYALLRIIAGILLTLVVTYLVTQFSDDHLKKNGATLAWVAKIAKKWMNFYMRFFRLNELIHKNAFETPAMFFKSWLLTCVRLTIIFVPMLFFWSVVTAAIMQILPPAFGNNASSILISAVSGTLLMASTWTEIPVALQLIQSGFSGPAAAMLVVLPPISLPAMLILGGSMGRLKEVLFLGIAIMCAGVIAGFIFI